MDSVFELERQTHEEIERFHRALYTILSRPQPDHAANIRNEHRAATILDRLTGRSKALNGLYEDTEARDVELAALSKDDVSQFYSRLAKLQEHHTKYPDSVPDAFQYELAALVEDETYEGEEDYDEEDPVSLLFSGEEVYGKYLDLYANHTAYTNLKNLAKRPTYLQYLDLLLIGDNSLHHEVPKEVRLTKDYETYIQNLHAYLLSFVKRTKPLLDVETEQKEALDEFEKKWEAGEITDWEVEIKSTNETGIWCSACQKHYSKQTVFDAHLTSKKHIKAAQKQAQAEAPPSNPNGPSTPVQQQPSHSAAQLRAHNAARQTYLSTALLTTLKPIVNDTKSNVERRFSLTAREREQELLDQAKPPPPPKTKEKEAEEEEEEEERIYNPLKLPLGWDGKPIPYWLYKLHGLGVEYRCEICSDHVYMGRKNFERHFQEARHAFGMRALGLPNTKHFHEITSIKDALTLAEKLRQEGRKEMSAVETMEEVEDAEGNVYNRKTFEDLRKQGII